MSSVRRGKISRAAGLVSGRVERMYDLSGQGREGALGEAKREAIAAAVAARLTPIDSATISKKLCNSLMVMMVLLRAAVVVAAQHRVLLDLRRLQHCDR